MGSYQSNIMLEDCLTCPASFLSLYLSSETAPTWHGPVAHTPSSPFFWASHQMPSLVPSTRPRSIPFTRDSSTGCSMAGSHPSHSCRHLVHTLTSPPYLLPTLLLPTRSRPVPITPYLIRLLPYVYSFPLPQAFSPPLLLPLYLHPSSPHRGLFFKTPLLYSPRVFLDPSASITRGLEHLPACNAGSAE